MGSRTLAAAIGAAPSFIARTMALLAISFVACTVKMAAVDPHRLISQYGHTAWRTQDGFMDRPFALTQTADGYIWVGTSSGLVRFDGVTFRPWAPPGGEPLPYITDLLGARDGSLWIGTSDGLFLLRDSVLSSYDKKQGAPGISAIVEDHSGTIWLTRYGLKDRQGPLCRVTGATLQCFGKDDGIPGRYGLGMAEDNEGNLWFGCQALCRWAPGSSQIYFQEQFKNMSGNGVSRVAMGPSGTLWATLEGTGPKLGVQYYSGGKWSSYVVPGFDGRTVVSEVLLTDRNHTLWVGTESGGLYHIHDGFADHYGAAQGLSGNYVQAIYEDKEGNIWVATDRGIDEFRDLPVVTFSGNEGLVGAEVHSVFALEDGSVWATNEGALDIIRPGGISAITTGHGLPGQSVGAVFKDSARRMWLGIDEKIMTYKQGRFLEVKKSDGSPAGLVGSSASFAEDIDGNMWVLTDTNSGEHWLLRIRGDQIKERIRIDKLFPLARYIGADRDGGLWVLYQRNNLARYVNGRAGSTVSLTSPNGFGYAQSLFVDSDNVIWVTATHGLFRVKNGAVTVMDSRNGLPCSVVYSMVKDNDKAYWLYTRCGLVRISMSDWASWLKSPESKVSARVYDALDGAQADISTPYQSLVSKSPDGRLWFASNSFVQMVDPSGDYANVIPPPVHVEEIVADHKRYDLQRGLALPPLTNELEINYTALSLAVPRRVLFRYKLEGHDQQWQEAGTRRQAFYNDLGPGHYRFRVTACNNDGVWNQAGTSLDFSILPAYYQTAWFRAICAAAFLALLWIAYQFRVRRLRGQFAIALEARLNERTRIAQELHDTLLQGFISASMQLGVADRQLPEDWPAKAIVTDVLKLMRDVIEKGRKAVQGMRLYSGDSDDLERAFSRIPQELVLQRPASFRVLVEGQVRPLHPLIRDEVYRIGREALVNAFRHSEAASIEIELEYGDRELRVLVRDNGCGIDPQVLQSGREGHWGLSGMRERAAKVGASLKVWSDAAAGTEVELSVPGRFAYRLDTSPRRLEWFAGFGRRKGGDHAQKP